MNTGPNALTSLTVAASEEGQTVQAFLAGRLGISRRAAKKMQDDRQVWVNRQLVWMAHHVVRRGDILQTPAKESRSAKPQHMRVLIEDAHYLFVDKPAGIMTVGADGVEDRLRKQLVLPALRVIHRLDRDTSGCLMVARTDAAFQAAVEVFKTRRVLKVYHAICVGALERRASTIRDELDGEPAVTHLTVLASTRDATYLALRIETGRTHQIRRHLAGVRHPVIGDRQYGLKSAHDPRLQQVARQMLHATDIELPHPMQPGILRAHSPLPADFRRCLRLFRL
ncbi:MAG: RluA family pseudouridine synthase [Kiritimatiellia bacterium]